LVNRLKSERRCNAGAYTYPHVPYRRKDKLEGTFSSAIDRCNQTAEDTKYIINNVRCNQTAEDTCTQILSVSYRTSAARHSANHAHALSRDLPKTREIYTKEERSNHKFPPSYYYCNTAVLHWVPGINRLYCGMTCYEYCIRTASICLLHPMVVRCGNLQHFPPRRNFPVFDDLDMSVSVSWLARHSSLLLRRQKVSHQ